MDSLNLPKGCTTPPITLNQSNVNDWAAAKMEEIRAAQRLNKHNFAAKYQIGRATYFRWQNKGVHVSFETFINMVADVPELNIDLNLLVNEIRKAKGA